MVVIRLLLSPVKLVLFIARVMGYNRFVIFCIGVVVGLLLAPTTGAELRARIREQAQARAARGADPTPVAPLPV